MNVELLLETLLTINCLLIYKYIKKKKQKTCKKRPWVKPWLRRRSEETGALSLLNDKEEDIYKSILRLNEVQFNKLLNLVRSDIEKENTLLRETISAKRRLEITLRFLATGETYRSLMYNCRVHESTISLFVPQVCQAIHNNLKNEYLKTPTTSEEWSEIAKDFELKWNFPNCLGALDGKHIRFSAPISCGSYYYNYKGTNSIVLLGLVDANYKFIYINLGVNGRISDGGVFRASNLYKRLEEDTLNLPSPKELPNSAIKCPYVFIADDAFPLMENLLKPYPQRGLTHEMRIFNYRLSRARLMVESAFGILTSRWRVLLNSIHLSVKKVEMITLACVVLHNFLIAENPINYLSTIDNSNTTTLENVTYNFSNNSAVGARDVRDNYKKYFNSPSGAVPWQESAVAKGNW